MVNTANHPWPRPERLYLPEHTIMMELHLGRQMRRNEKVYHANGIRADNRLENLQLKPPFANRSPRKRGEQ